MSRYRRNNHTLTVNGETKLLTEWEEETGVSRQLIYQRLKRGMRPDLAVYTLPRKYTSRAKNEEPNDLEQVSVRSSQEHQDGDQSAPDR